MTRLQRHNGEVDMMISEAFNSEVENLVFNWNGHHWHQILYRLIHCKVRDETLLIPIRNLSHYSSKHKSCSANQWGKNTTDKNTLSHYNMSCQPWFIVLSPVYSWVLIIISYLTFNHVFMVYYVACWWLTTHSLMQPDAVQGQRNYFKPWRSNSAQLI